MKKCFKNGVLIIFVIVLLCACSFKKLEKIEINSVDSMAVGDEVECKIIFYPDDVMDNLEWSSSDDNIISIQNGKLVAKNEGKAVITVTTSSGIEDYKEIEVFRKVESINLNETSLNLNVGDTFNLLAFIEPENATYKEILWTSNNPSVVTVDSNGLIYVVSYGEAVIYASTKDGMTAKCILKVNKDKSGFYLNENIRWSMSVSELEDVLNVSGSHLKNGKSIYVSYSPKMYDYNYGFVKDYVYWFENNQLRAFWYIYDKGDSCSFDNYFYVKDVLMQKYGSPKVENFDWNDDTYKNNKDKWKDAFKYDDFKIKTSWKNINFELIISWDYSDGCHVAFAQPGYASRL